jgi:hypothetical protein
MKLWDTETGKCVNKFTSGKTPHVVRINPSTPHEFLAGMADKKILQYDTRSGEMVQEYDHHLGPVNTITFCDEVGFYCFPPSHLLTVSRTVASSLLRTTSLSAHGSMASLCPSSSSPNHICFPWCAHLRIPQENTSPSSPRTTRSQSIPRLTVSVKTVKRATEDTMLPVTRLTCPSVLMDSLSPLATVGVMCASGTGKRVRCGTRSRRVMHQSWQCNGIRGRRPRSSRAISMVRSSSGIEEAAWGPLFQERL